MTPIVAPLGRRWRSLPLFALAAIAVVTLQMLPPLLCIGLAIAIAGSVLVLTKPWTGVAVLVLFLPFNNLLSQLLGGGPVTSAIGATKDALLGLLLIAAVARRRIFAPLVMPVVAFVVIGFVGFAYASSVNTGLYGWRNDFEPALLLIAVPGALTVTAALRMRVLIVAVAQIAATVSFVTWHKGLPWLLRLGVWPPDPDRPTYGYFSAGSLRPRAFSPLAAPNELAAYLDMVLAVIWTQRGWSLRRKLTLSILPMGAVFISKSRSGMLGIVLLGCFLAVRAGRRTHIRLGYGLASLFGLTFGVMLMIYLGRGGIAGIENPSTVGHLLSVRSGFDRAITHPLGYGLGDVGPRAEATTSSPVLVESYWLLLALESGILALAAYLLLVGRTTSLCMRGGDDATLGVAAVVAVLVSQLVLPTMQDGPVSFTFWLVIGLALRSIPKEGSPGESTSITTSASGLRAAPRKNTEPVPTG